MQCNLLMCVAVGGRLPIGLHHCYVRSAGTLGYTTALELISTNRIPIYIEVGGRMGSGSVGSTNITTSDNATSCSVNGGPDDDGNGSSIVDVFRSPTFDDGGDNSSSDFAVVPIHGRTLPFTTTTVTPTTLDADDENAPITVDEVVVVVDGEPPTVSVACGDDGPISSSLMHHHTTVYCHLLEKRRRVSDMDEIGDGDTVYNCPPDWQSHPTLPCSNSIRYNWGVSSSPPPVLIHENFMRKCPAQKVDLEVGYEEVRKIRDGFLAYAPSLSYISLVSFESVTNIGNDFMTGCESLVSIDLPSFTSLTKIGRGFLSSCDKLTSINFNYPGSHSSPSPASISSSPPPAKRRKLTHVGMFFLTGCASLKSVDLSFLESVSSLEQCFMARCNQLETIDMSPLRHLRRVEGGFLSGCESLKAIDLSPFQHFPVTLIPSGFLAGCVSLQSIDTTPLVGVTTLHSGFLAGCSALKMVDLRPMVHVSLEQKRNAVAALRSHVIGEKREATGAAQDANEEEVTRFILE